MSFVTPEIERLRALCSIKSNLLRLKWLAAATRFELALVRHDRALKAGFNPNQPRVPAGSREGGQWTDGGGATRVAGDDGRSERPVDIRENAHVMAEHVKSPQYVLRRVREMADHAKSLGDTFEGLSAGSFSSLHSANSLVNSTIGQNQARIDRVASGLVQYDEITARFSAPTGFEGYVHRTYS